MPIWSELEKALKQNEEDLRANRRLPLRRIPGPTERIQDFSFQAIILIGQLHHFPTVEVDSQIGSYLMPMLGGGMTDFSLPFHELVHNAYALKLFAKYSTMGFLDPHGRFISPQQAVLEAEKIEPHKGEAPRRGMENHLPPTPGNLKDGVWHHIPTGTEFPIRDDLYRSGAPGHGDVADAPILALGNNLHRTLAVSADTDVWYEENPPPAAPRNPQMNNAYVRSLRSYLKKMAIQLIERDNWFLLWHGYLYTNRAGMDFSRVFSHSTYLRDLQWRDDVTITELDANNAAHPVGYATWKDLKDSKNSRAVGGEGGTAYNSFYAFFRSLGEELRTQFPQIFARRPQATEDIELTGELLHALVEGRLDESLTYNQMLTATAQYWQTRLKTVRNVHTAPPGLVMLKDGTVNLSFDFVSKPSTEGRPHQGYVKFVPERGQPNLIDKLKDFLGRIGQQVKRFVGKKVPPRALKGSDLRKMLCEVSCDCKDFKYRMSYANVKQGVTTQAGRTDNGRAPVRTNPARRPGFCKHILATLRYLTDDAEIQISKDLSAQQQEALKKDRAQFYKEAEVAYEQMKAPAAKGAEEIEPEEEPAPSPEFAKLPAPPKPELAPKPAMPVSAPAPPGPNYQSTQV
jgi:hypothetical protein